MRRVVWVLLLGFAACGKRAHDENAERPAPLDPSTIYPLIVRANDLPTGPVRRPLVDGLVVTLASAPPVGSGQAVAGQGQAKLLREPDLQGLALDAAYTTALANLEAAAKRGEIAVRAEKQEGEPVDIVWGHDWRAAACLLLPGARQQATVAFTPVVPGSRTTGSAAAPTVYAAIPNRDVLVFFADPAVGKAALAAEPGGTRPLSDQILRVLPTDQPFWIQPPVAWAR